MGNLSRDLASLRIERQAPPPRSRKFPTWLLVLLVVGALAAGVVAILPKLSARVFKQEVQLTEIALVSPAQSAIDLSSTGYVQPQIVAKVGPKLIGRISKVNIKEGSQVKAGDVLFELDPTDQKTALATSKAKVNAAAARAAAARARANAAKMAADEVRALLARQKKLAESGAVAASTVEDLELKLKGLDAQVAVANADTASAMSDVSGSQVEVGVYEANLAGTTILAPINGTAVSKPASVGDVVQPGVNILVELADFDSLLVETDVPEARLDLIKAGRPCEVVLDAFSDKRLRGEVAEISPKLNRAKATATVKVKITDTHKDVEIRPEMAARVSFLQKKLDDEALKAPSKRVVPANAVVDRNGSKHVFVVDSGKVKLVPITLGAPFGSGFELKEGPPPGTKVVKDAPAELNDGAAIKEGSA
jgi:HlyD family secretion protein